jgi:hypothetical protein
MRFLYVLAFAMLVWLLPSVARAEATPPAGISNVTVGVYLNQMPSMSLRENKFTVDFYIWFRWVGDDKPYNSFEVVGGKIDSKQQSSLEKKDGVNYACYRILATINNYWQLRDFPFDNHVLRIVVEDGDSDVSHMKYIPDTQNSGVGTAFIAPGWAVRTAKATASEVDFTYNTNYGDLSRPPGSPITYSRFVYAVPLEREGMSHVFKLFFALYVAVGISLLSLFIGAADIGPRIGLAVGAVFASVGASYVISTNLPPSSSFTRAEWVNLISIAFLLLSLIVSVTSLRIFRAGNKERSLFLDKWGFRGLATLYAVLNILALVLR